MNFSALQSLVILGLATIAFCSDDTTTTASPDNSTDTISNSTRGDFLGGFLSSLIKKPYTVMSPPSTNNISIDTKFECNNVKPWCLMCTFNTRRKDHPETKTVDIGSTLMTCSNQSEIAISEHFEYNSPTSAFETNMVVIHSCTDDGVFLKVHVKIPDNESSRYFLNGLSLTNFGQGLVDKRKQRL